MLAIFPLAKGSRLLGALRDVIARWVPPAVPSLVVSLSSAVTVGAVGCLWVSVEGWQPMPVRGIAYVALSSLLLASGYQFLIIALRSRAEYSVMGAFRYGSVLWAILIGYALWGDVPNGLAFLGIAVVMGSGLYILHRERVRALQHQTHGDFRHATMQRASLWSPKKWTSISESISRRSRPSIVSKKRIAICTFGRIARSRISRG